MNPVDRELAHVPRWCIVRTNRQQSVAEHAFFVTRYALNLCTVMGLEPTTNFISYCLRHDDEELHSGDIPAPYKKTMRLESIKPSSLHEMEWMILKAADLLEAILFLVDEQLLGNKTVHVVMMELTAELRKLTSHHQTKSGEWLDTWLMKRIDAHQTYQGRRA
jgi:hypothetical protein